MLFWRRPAATQLALGEAEIKAPKGSSSHLQKVQLQFGLAQLPTAVDAQLGAVPDPICFQSAGPQLAESRVRHAEVIAFPKGPHWALLPVPPRS